MRWDYWRPIYKWQLVEWFYKMYPTTAKWKWERMTKRQLYGKYKEVRENG